MDLLRLQCRLAHFLIFLLFLVVQDLETAGPTIYSLPKIVIVTIPDRRNLVCHH
jgi:hypothetical protein